jgi:hypothetical protein
MIDNVVQIVMLILAWYFKAQEMGYFTREEFISGLEKLNVDSIEKLKAKLPQLREDLTDPVKFKEIYRYAFNFMKEDQKSRTVGTFWLWLSGKYKRITTMQMIASYILSFSPYCFICVKYLSE